LNRRGFLSSIAGLPLAAAFAGLPAVAPALAAVALSPGNIFKTGAPQGEPGRLWVSSDGGRTWRGSANFGPDVAITGIDQDGPLARLRLESRGQAFTLVSDDGKRWRTE
jgi:photosystem II stability/assembly factor-like uncharacterized protein